MIERLGGCVVACSFLLVLSFLRGSDRLAGRRVETVLTV
jgi:hypothetical protein